MTQLKLKTRMKRVSTNDTVLDVAARPRPKNAIWINKIIEISYLSGQARIFPLTQEKISTWQ